MSKNKTPRGVSPEESQPLQTELDALKERLRMLATAAAEGICLHDGGVVLECNQAFARMFGYEPEQIVGKDASELTTPETYQNIKLLIEQGTLGACQGFGVKKDGSVFPCLITGQPYEHGGRQLRVASFSDLTEQHQAELALKESEEKYRDLVGNLRVGIYRNTGGPAGKFLYANQAIAAMFGYGTVQEFLQVSVVELYQDPADRQRFVDELNTQGYVNDRELRLIRKDGSKFWGSATATIKKDPDGNVQWMDGIIEDIDRRKRAERRLRETASKFSAITATAKAAIVLMDHKGKITYWNPAAENMFGHTEEEALGRELHTLLVPERYQADFKKGFAHFQNSGTGPVLEQTMELLAVDKAGSDFPVEFSASAIKLDGHWHAAGIIRDVRVRKQAEELLRFSEERFRSLSENAPDIIYTLDNDGAFDYVNPAWERILGHGIKEVIGRYMVDFAPSKSVREFIRIFKTIRDQKQTVFFRGQLERKNGEVGHFDMSGAPNLDAAGRVIGMVGTLKDITKQIGHEVALEKSQASLMRAQKMARMGNWELDIASGEATCSDQIFDIFGFQPGQGKIEMDGFLQSVHRDDQHLVKETVKKALAGSGVIDLEHRIVRPDGQVVVVQQRGEVERDDKGQVVRLMGAVQDITALRRSEEQMLLLARIFENTIEGILVTDRKGVIEMVNQAFSNITGYSSQEALGQTPSILSSQRHQPQFYEDLWSAIKKEGSWQGEIWNRRKNGEAYPEWLTITAVTDRQGEVSHYVGVFHDITEIKRSEERITHQAYHDALTGLPNRMLFNDRLNVALAHAARKGQGLAVLFLDVDNFKNINDSMGHAAGDVLLQSVATRLSRWVREEDSVARIGGDEFIMLLQGTKDPDYVVHVASRILESMAEPFKVKDQEFYISASIGITLYPHDGRDTETLVSNADIAMYRAKEEGRNRYKLFTPAMNAKLVQRLDLETNLRKALQREEFIVYYQPKVDLTSGKVVGLEALVRWERPGVGLVPPDDFIPLAEDTGLIVPIGEWVLRTACVRTQLWRKEGFPELQVAVNLSPRQFQQHNLVEMVESILKETGLPSKCLELEITENVVMQSVDKAIATLGELANLGVQLSMDDFGRGYSSLYYLKRFPMHALKIDKSFVGDIDVDPDGASIVHTIINMSRSLNLKVIAEGVETSGQLDFLREHHCDQLQGFLFSKPQSDGQISALLAMKTLIPEKK